MSTPALVLMGIAVLLVGILACQECGLWSTVAAVILIVTLATLELIGERVWEKWRERWDHSK